MNLHSPLSGKFRIPTIIAFAGSLLNIGLASLSRPCLTPIRFTLSHKEGSVMQETRNFEKTSFKELGIIQIWGSIGPEMARDVCEEIITMNVEDRFDRIQMLISSPGGDCYSGFAIIDMMSWSKLPVHTFGAGIISSMALAIFIAGARGHRLVTPNTSLMSHRFSSIRMGNHAELVATRKEEDHLHKRLLDHYRRHTNLKSDAEITARVLREVDTWLMPQEAVEMGLADAILEKPQF
jgi:ATP-dependent Clp protease, protease subunit